MQYQQAGAAFMNKHLLQVGRQRRCRTRGDCRSHQCDWLHLQSAHEGGSAAPASPKPGAGCLATPTLHHQSPPTHPPTHPSPHPFPSPGRRSWRCCCPCAASPLGAPSRPGTWRCTTHSLAPGAAWPWRRRGRCWRRRRRTPAWWRPRRSAPSASTPTRRRWVLLFTPWATECLPNAGHRRGQHGVAILPPGAGAQVTRAIR